MPTLDIAIVPLLRDNYGYLLIDRPSGTVGVVDPGEAGPVLERLQGEGLELAWILTTHHHGDHTGGNAELRRATHCRIAAPAAEAGRIGDVDIGLKEGDVFALGASRAAIIETPGHTAGHIVFHFEEAEALFAGDTLFVMGCGRLLERDGPTMWSSLEKLMALPEATRVYCGHEYTLANARFALTVDGDNQALVARSREVEAMRAAGTPTVPSTMAVEKATNPFLRAADPAIRRGLGMERASDAEVFSEIRARKDRS